MSVDDALQAVKEAYFLGAWLLIALDNGSSQALPKYLRPAPVKPEHEALVNDNERLKQALDLHTEDLEKAKAELAALQQAKNEAQAQIAALTQEIDYQKMHEVQKAGEQFLREFDVEPAETRRRITMEDAFSEYSLTAGQVELVKQLDQFLKSKECSVFLLNGYAGTGKTFITKGLTEYFRDIGRNYVLAAPTGKASKVIARKTGSEAFTIHKTIYSFKDIKEYKDEDINGTETYKLYAQLAVNELSADTVYIIDEASMISDIYNEPEFFRCGSGHLLTDLLKFINIDHNDHTKKVIFIGDNAQLPPVGMKFSPALDASYLSKHHNIKTQTYELTEVVRQKADSGVMINSIELRKGLKANTFNQLDIDLSYPDIQHIEYADLMQAYLQSCDNKINAESIVIAHSNHDVSEYNRRIREHFFPRQPEVVPGDKVMAVTNSDNFGFFISNGDFGQIRKVYGPAETRFVTLRRRSDESGQVEEIPVTLEFRDIEVAFRDLDGKVIVFNAKIVENLLYSDNPSLSSDENKAVYLDFCIRYSNLRRGSLEFKETLRADPYFNALRVKFGSAITCHKAQGSEWNNVFVKCKTHQNQLSADYFRWLYTAITRTAQKLYLLDEPHIKLGSGMKMVSSGMPFTASVATTVAPIAVAMPVQAVKSEQAQATSDETFGIPANADFFLAMLTAVKNAIAGSGIEIINIGHQQYQESYHFKQGNDVARVNLSYSSKQKITQINLPQPTTLAMSIVTLLKPLEGKTQASLAGGKKAVFEFADDFLEAFHNRLEEICQGHGITIHDVEARPFVQRYTFCKANDIDIAMFDFFYNGKKQFTSTVPLSNGSSAALLAEVEQLITEGLSS